MKEINKLEVMDIVDILFSDLYLYNTSQWVELQSILLQKLNNIQDFSIIERMIEKANKREDYQVIEFICSQLNDKWANKLWSKIKKLVRCKSRDARYRALSFYSYLAESLDDYLEIINCLDDPYQDVRLNAFDIIVNKHNIIFKTLNNNDSTIKLSIVKTYNQFYNMDCDCILQYIYNNKNLQNKKIFFLIIKNKTISILTLKKVVDILDDQDIFDYFYRYIVT